MSLDQRSWPTRPLGEVAETALGKMLDRGRTREGALEVPYLRNVNVQWDAVDTSDLLKMELMPDELERFAVRPGDLLVCEGGEVGRGAIWQGGSDYIAYQKAIHRIRSRGELDLKFLRYVLEHYRDAGELDAFTTGSTIQHLPQQQLRSIPIPVPPLEEQRRIVAILDDHLSRIDAAAAALSSARRRARTLLASWETRALLGAAETVPITDLVEIQGGLQKQPKRRPVENRHPFLRVANVTADGLDLTEVHEIELFEGELDRYALREGDLLVVEGNGSASQIGRAATWDGSIADCVHQNHLIRIRPSAYLDPDYLALVWNSPRNRALLTEVASSSSGLYTLSVRKLSQVTIPVRPLEEQIAMSRAHRDLQSDLDRSGALVSNSRRRGTALRRSLLEAAFSGRLTSGRAVSSSATRDLTTPTPTTEDASHD